MRSKAEYRLMLISGIVLVFLFICQGYLKADVGQQQPSEEIQVVEEPQAVEETQAEQEPHFTENPQFLQELINQQMMQTEAAEDQEDILIKKSNWSFYSGAHQRLSGNVVGDTVDLDKRNHADQVVYLGYAYDFTFDIRHISGPEFYAFIERRGRADYDAPLWGNNSIQSLFGRYHWYNHAYMSPRLREFWTELPLTKTNDLNFKFGLYPYGREVGHRIALGGKYENYGITASGVNESCEWNLHYEKEDLNNHIHLGKVIDFNKNALKDNDTSAFFYAGDVTFKLGKQSLQLYMGWLQDWTPDTARSSVYATRVKKEDLITPGFDLKFNLGKWSFDIEGAKNFGRAKSINKSLYPDVRHQGILGVADAKYDLGLFKPKAKFIYASGNEVDQNDYNARQGGTLYMGDENNAFSVFSPLNTNLTDTHYQKQFGPYVAMAGGYAVNFGVSRPGTFGDPFMFENIIATSFGFDYAPLEKVYIGIDYWYLRSDEPGVGLDGTGVFREFSTQLGQEVDIFASYQLTKSVKISLLGGYFFPGLYYKETRSDTTSIFSNTPRKDGEADGAYQVELGFDITF